MEHDTYLTLSAPSQGEYKEKGSKFLAFAFPVSSEEEVKAHLASLRKTYFDARHHCYAYMIGKQGALSRANDDGEPNHSAGTPILGQIRSKNLTDVLLVVVRYFGGTKLGVSGLIAAYKTAAAEALAAGSIAEKRYTQPLPLSFEYTAMNSVMKVVKDFDLPILQQNFGNQCEMVLEVRESLMGQVRAKLDFAILPPA
jgi:uncharacterized YigZ family protein